MKKAAITGKPFQAKKPYASGVSHKNMIKSYQNFGNDALKRMKQNVGNPQYLYTNKHRQDFNTLNIVNQTLKLHNQKPIAGSINTLNYHAPVFQKMDKKAKKINTLNSVRRAFNF